MIRETGIFRLVSRQEKCPNPELPFPDFDFWNLVPCSLPAGYLKSGGEFSQPRRCKKYLFFTYISVCYRFRTPWIKFFKIHKKISRDEKKFLCFVCARKKNIAPGQSLSKTDDVFLQKHALYTVSPISLQWILAWSLSVAVVPWKCSRMLRGFSFPAQGLIQLHGWKSIMGVWWFFNALQAR